MYLSGAAQECCVSHLIGVVLPLLSVCCGQGLSGMMSRIETVEGKVPKHRRNHKENDCKILRVKSGST